MNPTFDHEKLDVNRIALEFVAWAFRICQGLPAIHKNTKEQLIDSSQSIVRNIAEGNGKRSPADRRRFFEIARGSGMESAASIDTLLVCGAITKDEATVGKQLLHRVVSMLSKMTAPIEA